MKKIISTILATALLCSSATVIPASSAWDNNGKRHNYNKWTYYHTNDPAGDTNGWSAQVIKTKDIVNDDGAVVGTLKCHYNKDFLGSDEAKAGIAGQSAGIYYDCYVVEVGKKTARSSTTRGKGNSTKWMNDSNGSTNWYGNVYWD